MLRKTFGLIARKWPRINLREPGDLDGLALRVIVKAGEADCLHAIEK